jgi:hypothetical protein
MGLENIMEEGDAETIDYVTHHLTQYFVVGDQDETKYGMQ